MDHQDNETWCGCSLGCVAISLEESRRREENLEKEVKDLRETLEDHIEGLRAPDVIRISDLPRDDPLRRGER